ncbi:MAG: phage virion morphogenesis protein [Sodalis sp. (in: enterobacteria)]|uniref:phage virion morphogenesis protein n=1 Tax=Sodalis sp. (in: enterobacteria) TaxID=1898979 RepID=UPI003F3C8BC4
MIDVMITVPDTLRQALERLSQSLSHRPPLMRTFSEELYDAVMENFEQEKRPRWLPIDRAGKILQQSGWLAASIDSDADNDQAVVGTNVVYARIHQQGTATRPHIIRPRYKKALAFNGRVVKCVNHPGLTIPARPFLSLTDQDYQVLVHTVNDYLQRVLDE